MDKLPKTKEELEKELQEQIAVFEKAKLTQEKLLNPEEAKEEDAKEEAKEIWTDEDENALNERLESLKTLDEEIKEIDEELAKLEEEGEEGEEPKTELENKKADIEKRRQEELSKAIIDESEVKKMVDRMLGDDEIEEYKKKNQIKSTFEDNLVDGTADRRISQIIKETEEKYPIKELMWRLTDMTIYSVVIEKGKELGLIDNDKYKSLIEKVQKAKSIMENKVNEYINEVNAKYDAELTKLDGQGGNDNEPSKKESATEDTKETKPYDIKFIEDTLKKVLQEKLKILKEIKSLKIEGAGNEMKLQTKLTVEVETKIGKLAKDVSVGATIGNGADKIKVNNYSVDAGFGLNTLAKSTIKPHLDKVSDYIKEYLENIENKKVVSMKIENGELKVEFEKEGNPKEN